jgi:hypothetical protein
MKRNPGARLYDGDTFDHRGHVFRVTFPPDESMGEPWNAHDGHGIVTEWTTRDADTGERVLCEDRNRRRYYDVSETVKIAKRDGWGLHLTSESPSTQAERAVDADFERMRAWCNEEWAWIGVVVTLDEDRSIGRSLWGIESDGAEYLTDIAHELADEIMADIEVDEPLVALSEN